MIFDNTHQYFKNSTFIIKFTLILYILKCKLYYVNYVSLILRLFVLFQEYSLQSPNGQQSNGDHLDMVHKKQTKIKKIYITFR